MVKFSTAVLGFSRVGPNRELKVALEKHWKGQLDEVGLIQIANQVEDMAWAMQVEAGIDKVTVGDFCLYDNVLQWADWLGVVPARFQSMEGGMGRMFAMARGVDGAPALSMKKWLTSNYHYMVPEVDETLGVHVSAFTSYLESVKRGIDKLGAQRATPVVMGPVSFVRFCTFKQQGSQELQRFALLEKLLPVYKDLLAKLKTMGVKEIQIHEPALVFADTSLKTLFQQAYPCILPTNVAINMVSFFEGVSEDNFKWLLSVPQINILSLDFTRGDNLDLVKKFGVAGKTIGAGVIDGRNVWKIDPAKAIPVLKTLSESDAADIRIQPSCSLQFVPWDIECEHDILAEPLGSVLAFGQQKLKEVSDVCSVAAGVGNIDAYVQAWQSFQVNRQENTSVTNRVASLTESDFSRSEPYAVRRKQQLPGVILPTTTIGSFPQTKEIRSLRHQLKKGKISLPEYERAIDQQIAMMIGIQEGLGLDILVHGEPERTDMVEFFGQQMEGMAFTTNGWVQSFGSRCVRPPIIWTDISRPSSMTVREYQVAQLLTQKPVKGMLTGPVTILNWSFNRVDISRKEQAFQIALALRDEVQDLEAAGCKVIQVDEPALREAMPLRNDTKEEYLGWTVDAFRLATAIAAPATQIHTHMCYCEFGDCMDAIDRLDTDVNSIENARSDDATLRAFQELGYQKGLGPGVYDIHSPVVPPVQEMYTKMKSFLDCMDPNELVINPDCGLKTRTWPETIAALKNMVAATELLRLELTMNKA